MNNFKDLRRFSNELYRTDISPEDYASQWETGLLASASSLADVADEIDILEHIDAFEAGEIAEVLGRDLQSVADSIAEAASAGISTDLEAAAAGLGYGSFADAVAAYNEAYGTSYSAEEAAAELGN